MIDNLKIKMYGFYKYRGLLLQLVSRDIKVKYRKSVLGILWTVLNPLLMMLVMTLVFSHIFKSNIPNFPVYFLTGNILFNFNAEATTQSMYSIIGNAGLIKKVYIPKYLFPVSRVMSSLVNFFFSFCALIIVMLFTRAEFYSTMIVIIIPLFYLIMFTTGISMILAALTVSFRDISHLYGVLILAWTYFTPIFYPMDIIKENLRWLIDLNPMYQYIFYFRELIMNGNIPGLYLNLS